MPRERDRSPDFDRLELELLWARREWNLGNRGSAESILRMLGSFAISEATEADLLVNPRK